MAAKPLATSAADFLPPDERPGIAALATAAATCQGCVLHQDATQTVFGVGNPAAALMLIGEQPGDQEDRRGEPFIGPAGALLSEIMAEVGLTREEIYLTNAVKHFKFKRAGNRRIHAKPGAREIRACRPWLQAEVDAVSPRRILCLGATAAGAVIGKDFRITQQRGEVIATPFCDWTMATYHPSALLRVPDPEARESMRTALTGDLRAAVESLRK